MMDEITPDGKALLARITKIVENLIQKDSSYQYYLNKDKAIQMIFN